jgi:conjugative relaxase-like TrwC/TraI family protein
MLSIGKLVAGQQRYYDQQVARGGDDYYSGRGEAPGEWLGRGATALGLEGPVSAAHFSALIAGDDPRDERVRLRSGTDPKVAAFDLTFSAPKSVSVLFAVADEQHAAEIVAAHESAVRAAVGWMEDNAVLVRRGPQGHRHEVPTGVIAAAYRHRMSRALDPQLHTHVVVANLAQGADGRFTAVWGRPLYAAAKTAGYLYQAHLRAEITERLGLEWATVRKGAAELRAVPSGVLEEFSRRRHEMLRAAAEGGFSLSSKRSAEAAAVDTRSRKQYGIETHTWREEIIARAAEHGLDRTAVDALLDPGRRPLHRVRDIEQRVAGDDVGLGDRLAGPGGLTERANTFDERSVLQAFAEAAGQGARVFEVTTNSREFAERRDVLPTKPGEWTTEDLVDCEQRLIAAAESRTAEGCAVVAPESLRHALRRLDREPTQDQLAAVELTVSSGHGVQAIEALAGTGKTFVAGVMRAVYEDAGYEVIGVAPTGRAARELNDEAGIRSRTIDRALIDIEQLNAPIPSGAIVVLDEAGMAPTRLTARLLEHAHVAGAKVVALGDPGQLPSVLAGGWLRAVGERVGRLCLSEVLRQRDRGERRALGALHEGVPRAYLEWAERNGRIEAVDDADLRVRAISEWIDAGGDHSPAAVVMIARDNATRDALNAGARAHRGATGQLGQSHDFGLIELSVGDRVICRHGDGSLDVDNGMRGVVRDVDDARVVLLTDSGLVRELPATYVANHVELAYCLTGHGMQGATVDQAIVVAAPVDLTAGWSYSALSRARGETCLLIGTARQRIARDRQELAPEEYPQAMSREQVLASVASRMLERDDEDLAIEQRSPAGREDDTELARARRGPSIPPQEQAEGALDSSEPRGEQLTHLRTRLGDLQVALAALPTRALGRLDELDSRARELAALRADHVEELERLMRSRPRHGARRAHEQDIAFRRAALETVDRDLADVLGERTALHDSLGEPEQIRSEREGIEQAIQATEGELRELRDQLVTEELDHRPEWLVALLGDRPSQDRERRIWDEAARAAATYRLESEPPHDFSALAFNEPSDRSKLRDWECVDRLLTRAQHQLGLVYVVREPGRGIEL